MDRTDGRTKLLRVIPSWITSLPRVKASPEANGKTIPRQTILERRTRGKETVAGGDRVIRDRMVKGNQMRDGDRITQTREIRAKAVRDKEIKVG